MIDKELKAWSGLGRISEKWRDRKRRFKKRKRVIRMFFNGIRKKMKRADPEKLKAIDEFFAKRVLNK